MNDTFDPVGLIVTVASLSFIPMIAVTATSFLKISAVLLILRNALGLQQVPPNMALYGISLVISLIVMGPVLNQSSALFKQGDQWPRTGAEIIESIDRALPPLKSFMEKNTDESYRLALLDVSKKFEAKYGGEPVGADSLVVLMPAFVISEISAAFKIGVAIYLPFVIIDLAVSCILMALGMMMVSPMTIALPIKLILFVAVDGWLKILQGLIYSYL